MGDTDSSAVHRELQGKKAISFSDFVFGCEGGLNAKLLENASLTSLDMRYKVLPKGTKVYNRKSDDDRVLVFSTTIEALLSVLEPHLEEWRDSEEVACFRAFEIIQDIFVVEVQEDIAREVCLLWCLSASKESKTKEEANGFSFDRENRDGEMEVSSTEADSSIGEGQSTAESGKERLMYKRLLSRSDRTAKNLLDRCFSTLPRPRNVSAILFKKFGSLQDGTLISADNVCADFVRDYQNIIVPQKLIDRLTTDDEGYLELCASPRVPKIEVQNGEDGTDGRSVSSELAVSEKIDHPEHSVEPIPNFDDFSNTYAEDAMDDYASIRFTTPPTTTTTTQKVPSTPAVAPGVEAAKPPSPRPGQPPPPPPVSQPIYSTVDKTAKKPLRRESLDLPDVPGGMALKPPRPPPVDSMPHEVKHSGGHSPAQTQSSSKPSRPSAPPKLKGTDRAMSVDSVNMGSSGNVSLDGKDENLVAPPRGKSRKSDTTRF